MRYHVTLRECHHWQFAKGCVEAGVSGFEVAYLESYLAPADYQAYLALITRLQTELDVSFTVHAPSKDLNLGSPNLKIREVAKEEVRGSIELARRLNSSIVIIHPAPALVGCPAMAVQADTKLPKTEAEGLAKQEENLVKSLQELADGAPDLLFGLENLVFPQEVYVSPKELERLIEKVNRSNVGLTLDGGHALVNGFRGGDFINLLADKLFHVHLHDNYGKVDQHLPLAQGVLDYVGIIELLKQKDYAGFITFEFDLANPKAYQEFML